MDITERYLQLLPLFLSAFIISLLITPWIGRLAKYLGAVDLPPQDRNSKDQTRQRRVHEHNPALLGGLGMVISLMVTLLVFDQLENFKWGLIVGIIIVTIMGFIDDIYELKALEQLGFQLLAAFVVVLSGITVTSIQVAGIFVDFSIFSSQFQVGEFIYNFIFPADILTIVWIVGLMNVMNWVGGVDGLNGSVSTIIATAMLLISMKLGLIVPALFLAAYIGGTLGVLPYNYHLSKIFYGSIGDYGNGYILAVLSIIAGTKLPLFLILLGLPFIDAIIVFGGRIMRNKSYLLRPWKVLSVSDKTHFHHRLLELGFSHKSVMFAESGITAALCAFAFYLSDFRLDFIGMIIAAGSVIVLISFLEVLQRKRRTKIAKQLRLKEDEKPKVMVEVLDKDKKSQYKY